jgi:hypothetical protein
VSQEHVETVRTSVDAYVHEFQDGLIRLLRAYLDHAEALAAVGLSEHDRRQMS